MSEETLEWVGTVGGAGILRLRLRMTSEDKIKIKREVLPLRQAQGQDDKVGK
jgi:hypothetical protein